MERQLAPESRVLAAPQFYVTPRQRFSLSSLILAVALAFACLFCAVYSLNHVRRARAQSTDDDYDPAKVDTIYLGDPGQAPVAARPKQDHPAAVHPFVLIHLPRTGDQVGQIPDSPTGRLLYAWLAAFNGSDPSALPKALPTSQSDALEASELELRRQTGGFTLVSCKEVEPGVLVFRLHDQTAAAVEALGTLRVRPESNPASIASFSLRAVPPPQVKLK